MQINPEVIKVPRCVVCIGLFLLLVTIVACTYSPYTVTMPNPYTDPDYPDAVFVEEFDDTPSGWMVSETGSGSYVRYEHQGLRIYINEENYTYFSRSPFEANNVVITVEALTLGGPDNNAFGVICRFQDADNYYAFLISSDGYYGIVRVEDSNYTILSGDTMDYSDVINQGPGQNWLQAECNGPILSLSANGEDLVSVIDTTFPEGGLGVMAVSYSDTGVDILFDNYSLVLPE